MQLSNIKEEQHLRDWLGQEVKNWNAAGNSRVTYEWIEPNRGSSAGISDCKLTYKTVTYGIELKHWFLRRDGVQYKIRPVQRRYNKMGVREGQKLLYLASVDMKDYIELVAIRGDRGPLRDYCSMLGSGCEMHLQQTKLEGFPQLLALISDPKFWIKVPFVNIP